MIMASKKIKSSVKSSAEITNDFVKKARKDFASSASWKIAQNAVTKVSLDEVALNRSIVTTMNHTFSNIVDDWQATNQKRSGRCWIFAGTNLFKSSALKKLKMKNFEFSQNYIMFWDKLEKANYFLEAIIDTADKPVDDRTVAFLLSRPLEDGGQWNMFVNVVKKHGLVPKVAMPETESSSNTGRMNENIKAKLREGAKTLRDLYKKGSSAMQLREAKNGILEIVYRILTIHLGTPPEIFDWQWYELEFAVQRKPSHRWKPGHHGYIFFLLHGPLSFLLLPMSF